jgi:hypothetical protein
MIEDVIYHLKMKQMAVDKLNKNSMSKTKTMKHINAIYKF